MDSCREMGAQLSAYLDGELDPAASRQVEAHLGACPQCSAEFAGLRQVKRFMAPGSPLAPVASKELAERVRASVYPRQPQYLSAARHPRFALPRIWRPGVAVATLLIAIVLVGVVGADLVAPSPVSAAAEATLSDHVICAQMGRVIQSLPGDVDQVSGQLAGVVGMSIAVPQGLPDGFHFAGGRAIRAGDITAAHLAWVNGSSMISFYQAADPGGSQPEGWREIDLDEHSYWRAAKGDKQALLWRGGGVLYILVSDLPEDRLLQVALAAQLPR